MQRNLGLDSVIDAIKNIKRRFTMRDHKIAARVRRLQHVEGVPPEETIRYYAETNGIKTVQ